MPASPLPPPQAHRVEGPPSQHPQCVSLFPSALGALQAATGAPRPLTTVAPSCHGGGVQGIRERGQLRKEWHLAWPGPCPRGSSTTTTPSFFVGHCSRCLCSKPQVSRGETCRIRQLAKSEEDPCVKGDGAGVPRSQGSPHSHPLKPQLWPTQPRTENSQQQLCQCYSKWVPISETLLQSHL